MKILINYIARKGGGPVYAYSMAEALINAGHDVYLVTSSEIENKKHWEKLNLAGSIYVNGYNGFWSFVFKTPIFRLFGKRKIKKYFKNIDLDASYHPMETLWGGIVDSVVHAKKYIVTMHDPIEHTTSGYRPNILKKIFLVSDKKKMTDVVILSSCFVPVVKERFGLDESHIHVIEHGNFDYYFKICEKEDYKYNPNIKNHFLYFGRIDAYKGLHVLAKAYGMMSKEEDVDLTVVGSGDFKEYQEEYGKLKNCTVINRWIKDEELASYFNGNSNVTVVLPYLDATQSGIIPIALSAKKLIIASRTGGLIEQIKENEECLMFNPGDAMDLFYVMKKSINYEKRALLIENGKKRVDSLSWDKSAKILINAIKN